MVVFGTGGETHPGSLWYISLDDLYHGDIQKVGSKCLASEQMLRGCLYAANVQGLFNKLFVMLAEVHLDISRSENDAV